MTKTIDEQLERLASAQERTATTLEGILEAVVNFKFEQIGSIAIAGVQLPGSANAEADNGLATEEATVEEAQVEIVEEAETEEQQPESEPEPEPESDVEDELSGEAEAEASDAPDDEGDPLGDGDAAVDEPVLPIKLTNDTLRGFARDLMEKEGKAAVFEVLAEVGKGYKAVGEVPKDDLKEAHLKMAARLKG